MRNHSNLLATHPVPGASPPTALQAGSAPGLPLDPAPGAILSPHEDGAEAALSARVTNFITQPRPARGESGPQLSCRLCLSFAFQPLLSVSLLPPLLPTGGGDRRWGGRRWVPAQALPGRGIAQDGVGCFPQVRQRGPGVLPHSGTSGGSGCRMTRLPVFGRTFLFQTFLLFLIFLLPLPLFLGCFGAGRRAGGRVMLHGDGSSTHAAPRGAQRDPPGPRCPVDQLPAKLVQHRLLGHRDGHRVVRLAPAESGMRRAPAGPGRGARSPRRGALTRRRGRAPRTPPCRRTRSRAPG